MFPFDVREWEETYVQTRRARSAHSCDACQELIFKAELYVEYHPYNWSFSDSFRYHRRCAIKKGLIPIVSGNRFRVVMTEAKDERDCYKIETDEGTSLILDSAQVKELVTGLRHLLTV